MGGRKLSDIAAALSSAVSGDGNLAITRLVHPADAEGPGDLAIALTDEALGHLAATTWAGSCCDRWHAVAGSPRSACPN